MNAISPFTTRLAHLYHRISSPAQLLGDGLGRQLDGTKDYVARHGLEIVSSYSDRGISAFRGKNRRAGELATILRHIESGVIRSGEHLVIESIDRLSRQPVLNALDTLKLIVEKGVIVHSVFDNKAFSLTTLNEDVGSLLALVVSMARSNEESRIKSERVAQAHQRGRENGTIVAGRVPSWIETVRDPKTGVKSFRVKDDIVDAERNMTCADIVRDMFEMSAKGLSSYKIAQVLTGRGIAPFGEPRRRVGSKATAPHVWNATSIIDLLTRKTALGEFRSHTTSYDPETGKRIQTLASVRSDYYPAIVSEELWTRANAAMRDRKRRKIRGSTGDSFANLFRDLTVCAHCGGAMHIRSQKETAGGARYTRLRCASRSENACSNSSSPRYQPIEDAILGLVSEIEFNDQRGDDVLALDRVIAAEQVKVDGLADEIRTIISTFKGSPIAIQMVTEKEAERAALAESVAANVTKRDAMASRQSPADRKAALRAFVAEMATLTGDDLYTLRVALNLKIKETIDRIEFNNQGEALVHLIGDTDKYLLRDIRREGVHVDGLFGSAKEFVGATWNGNIFATWQQNMERRALLGLPAPHANVA